MKVKELIEELEKLDKELFVYVTGDGNSYGIAEDVSIDIENGVVISGFGNFL